MTAIIYNRTSTDEQNPENQLKDCLSINKYGEYQIFQDKQSAWKDNVEREEFEKIIKLIKSGKVNHLIVWDLDRLFRNRKKLIEFFELCNAFKCSVHSFRQKWLEDLSNIPSPWNEIMFNLMLQIMGWLAEDESNKKSERVKLAVRKQEGKPTLSYKGNKWGRKPVKKEIKLQVIKLRKQGLSIRAISKKVTYWDKNNHQRNLSPAIVHKIITKYSSLINKQKESK